jgi:hypothetical protein
MGHGAVGFSWAFPLWLFSEALFLNELQQVSCHQENSRLFRYLHEDISTARTISRQDDVLSHSFRGIDNRGILPVLGRIAFQSFLQRR